MTSKTKTSKKRNSQNFKAHRMARIFRINNEAAAELQRVITAAWSFATASLWNRQQFSETESLAAKIKIGTYFLGEQDKDAAFHEYCQRILLTRKFLLPVFGGTLPLPSVWFDENNAAGYEATKELYNELVKQRKSEPSAMAEVGLTADAVLMFSKNPTSEAYWSFREDLLIIKAPEMSLLFQLFVANLHYEH